MSEKNSPKSAKEIMQIIVRKLGLEFAKKIYLDRQWLWYCGDSLQHQPAKRTVLKDLGFRFAPKGHPMKIGNETINSQWGNSCEHPIRRYKKPSHLRPQPQEESEVESVLAEI